MSVNLNTRGDVIYVDKFSSSKSVYWPFVIMGLFFNYIPEYLMPITIFSAIAMIAIYTRGNLELKFPKLSVFLVLISFIGIVSGIANQDLSKFGAYRFLRDSMYYLCPFLYWILGNAMGKSIKNNNVLWTTLFSASIASALSILFVGFFLNWGDISLSTFPPNVMTVLAVALCMFKPQEWIWAENHRRLVFFLTMIDLTAIVLSFSRTTLICLLILLAIFALRNLKALSRLIAGIALAIAVVLFAFQFMPQNTIVQFTDKINNSIDEISANKNTWDDNYINDDWRGYELFVAKQTFLAGSAQQQLLGYGFGYQLNLGANTLLVTDDSAGIPFLHNGYMSVLLKCGYVSLILLCIFYFYHIIRLLSIWVHTHSYQYGLAAGLVICVAVCSYIIHGIFIANSLWYLTVPLAILHGFFIREPEVKKYNNMG